MTQVTDGVITKEHFDCEYLWACMACSGYEPCLILKPSRFSCRIIFFDSYFQDYEERDVMWGELKGVPKGAYPTASPLSAQISDALTTIATWTPEKLRRVRLQGS